MISRPLILIVKFMVFFSLLTGPYLVYAFTTPVELSVDFPPKTHEYYVNLDAGSNGNGTVFSPWNNLESADGSVSIPAWIYVKGTGAATYWHQSGSSNNEIVITAWGSETAIFQGLFRVYGNYVIFDGKNFSSPQLVFDGQNSVSQVIRFGGDPGNSAKHVTLYRCEVKRSSINGMYADSDYLRVYNCKLHDSVSSHFVYFRNGDNCEFKNNIIWNAGRNGIQTNPHDSWPVVTDGIISGNAVHDCVENAFSVLSGTAPGGTLNGLLIANNITWNNGGGIKFTGGIDYSGTIKKVRVYNNTFYGSVDNGHGADASHPSTTYFFNNIVVGGISHRTGCSFIESGNNLTSNPGFLSTVESDENFLKLSSASTNAIDQGYDLISKGITVDYFGNSRPRKSGYDIGAHEYGLEAPQNLRIK